MSEEQLPRAELTLRIPFHDVDPMQVVWHGNYFRYMEQVRCELLRQIDYGYREMERSGFAWPIIDTRLKFIAPLHFDQLVRIEARLSEYENRLRIDYEFFDALSGTRTSKGYTIQVAVAMPSGEMRLVSPPILLQKLGLAS
jgi:acyl-CoA thioester hydrolase